MAYQKQDFDDDETLYAYQLELMEDGILDAEKMAEEAKKSSDVPFFDLAALGIAPLELSGGSSAVETEAAAEIYAALYKGAVNFGLDVIMDGKTDYASCTMHSFTDGMTMHQCVGSFIYGGLYFLLVVVTSGMVQASVMPLAALLPEEEEKAPPATIDMSAYESEGKIVETYADGTSGTTLFEFDAEGNPTKITDSAGNVTVLTW